MDIFRVSRNAWGQEVLLGISWDLLWVFFAAAVVFIVLHMICMWIWAPRLARRRDASVRTSGGDGAPG